MQACFTHLKVMTFRWVKQLRRYWTYGETTIVSASKMYPD